MKTSSYTLVCEQLAPYGFIPSLEQAEKIRTYAKLLTDWNKKMSLTTVVEPAEVLRTHFGESIFAHTTGLVKSGRLADVGTGAGFPGMALAIATSELEVTLIEPNLKKSVFLSEVKRELQLANVQVARGAMGDVEVGNFDYITARALGRFEEFLSFAFQNSAEAGKVVVWLGKADAKDIGRTDRRWKWRELRPIPSSDRRCILLGEK